MASRNSATPLYVGDLQPEVTESELYEKFSAMGAVLSIHVCREAITQKSLGYAYVNFHSLQDAEKALDTLNFELLMGKAMRIMWSDRNPLHRKINKGNVFIKNLHPDIDNKNLFDTFSAFGTVLSCKVQKNVEGISLGYGYINFKTECAAQQAVSKVNGMEMAGKRVFLEPFVPRQKRIATLLNGEAAELFTNIYVKELVDISEEKLRALFNPYGTILSAVSMMDGDGKPRGFGFLSFAEAESAARAVAEMNGRMVEGKNIYVGRAQKRTERGLVLQRSHDNYKAKLFLRTRDCNLYVRNLEPDVDDKELKAAFARFGTVTSAKVMMRHDVNFGYGFVCFDNPDSARNAVAEMKGVLLKSKPLFVAIAQRKVDRKAYLETLHKRSHPLAPSAAPIEAHAGAATVAAPPTPTVLPQPPPMHHRPVGGDRCVCHPLPPHYYHNLGYVRPILAAPQQMHQQQYPVMQNYGYSHAPSITQAYPRAITGNNCSSSRSSRSSSSSSSSSNSNSNSNSNNNNKNAVSDDQKLLDAAVLATAPPLEQLEILGRQLFPLVEAIAQKPDLTGKITGMLLEIETAEILHMIENVDALKERVNEALTVLREYQAKKDASAKK